MAGEPFDVVIVNGEVLGPKHPEYELALIFSLVVAAVPFAGGIAMRLREENTRSLTTRCTRPPPMNDERPRVSATR